MVTFQDMVDTALLREATMTPASLRWHSRSGGLVLAHPRNETLSVCGVSPQKQEEMLMGV